jgi:RNA polymerase sigma-70 factor (ECF subfamily)
MDETLAVPRAMARDAELGFDGFFDANRDRLARALWLVARDRHEAEEVAQEAFVRLWERWDRVSRLEDPQAYLYRTALNLYRNRRRRAVLALRRLVRAVPPADPTDAIDERDAIVRALGRLTPRQRSALVLTDLVEMTSEEAARALGVRPSTVRVLAARARAALREQIGGDDA